MTAKTKDAGVMKVGDPVNKHYGPLKNVPSYKPHWGKTIFFIKAIDKDTAQLAQEVHPMNHFSYAYISELRLAKFTNNAHKEMQRYRDMAIAEAEAET